MLKLTRRFFIALFIVTIVWAVLFLISIEEFRTFYQFNSAEPILMSIPGWGSWLLSIGIFLFLAWIISGVVKRNLSLCIALIGIVIAFGFFMAAITRDIGYSFDYVATIQELSVPPAYEIWFNPLLHLGGGTIVGTGEPYSIPLLNAMSIGNLVLYLVYGELISFSPMGFYLLSKKQYFKSHSIELVMILVGATIAVITLCSDFIALYGAPLLVIRKVFFELKKYDGMSILPPQGDYIYLLDFLPLVPLSQADVFTCTFQ
jgi:ABC-type cobalt transport system substrate-binding protein